MVPPSLPSRLRALASGRALLSLALILAAPGISPAAPVAVNDAYDVSEDLTLNTESGPIVSADFDTGNSAPIAFSGDWDYLDRIENAEGAAQSYPVDGAGRNWRSPAFDKSTSTIGPWGTTPFPVQGGTVDAFPGTTPGTLLGIGNAPSGNNLVTTYLFRNTFTLTAAQAAEDTWIANILADDGCVVSINGSEVARFNMPDGPITTETLSPNGNETTYSDITLNVAGALVTGPNTIAVELHQTTLGSSDAGLDLALSAGGGATGGFVYQDDLLGTNLPDYANGTLEAGAGFSGAGLRVTVGQVPFFVFPKATSGGFRRAFSLGSPTSVNVSLRYRLVNSNGLDPDDYGEAILDIDGIRYGNGTGSSLVRIADGGDSNWQTANFTVPLAAGNHTITLGAASNQAGGNNEVVNAYFDNIGITRTGGSTGGVLANDTVGANPSAAPVGAPAHGTLNFPSSGIFTYTPVANYFGPDSFTYRVTDGTGTSNTAAVTLNVLPVNDPPVAQADTFAATEDTVLVVPLAANGVLANDTDIENNALTAVLGTTTANGTLVLNPNGTFTYIPAANFFGSDSFTYRASDGAEQSAPATVTLNVAPLPDPPAPRNDRYSVEENQTLVIAVAVGGPGSGITETVVPTGSVWKYNDTGTDLGSVWRVPSYNDSTWASGPAELGYGDGDEATVVGFGGNPDARYPTTYFRRSFALANVAAISASTCWIRRDDGCVVFLNGTQIGISNLTGTPGYTTLASNAGDDGNSEIAFPGIDPSLFVEGHNTLAVEIHQNTRDSTDITFELRMQVTREVGLGVLANDNDPDGLPLTASLATAPSHGIAALHPDGTFTYTPALNHEGTDTFTYLADNGIFSTPATVTLTVTPGPNNYPETQPDTYAATEDTPLVRNAAAGVLANDIDPDADPLTALLKSLPSHGTVVLNANGSFTYTPAQNFFGADSFTYAALDGGAESPPQTVTLNVANTPDPPVAAGDSFFANPGQAITATAAGGVLANDFDPDRTALTAQLVQNVAAGTLAFNPNGGFTYTPPNALPATVTFTYRASDGALTSAVTPATLHLNTAPVAGADNYALSEDQSLTVPGSTGLLQNDSDAENNPLTAVLVAGPAHGTAHISPSGSFTYTPEANYFGADSFTYAANDGIRNSAPATVSLAIAPVNDAPSAAPDSYLATIDQTLSIPASAGVLANDVDVDSPTLTASAFGAPAHGSLILNPDGSFTYTPATGFHGTDTFTYRAGDGALNALPATVTLNVNAASASIVINEIMYHPASELDAHEYIELTNIGDGPVNLHGWSFSSGLSFTFPELSIPAGGFLVVAADPAPFTATYGPVPILAGGWTGSLSNSGERVRLVDAMGTQVDEVEYSDQGDWATRTRVVVAGIPGWTWESAHDGGGSSLELVFPRLTNKAGANWSPSVGAPTPGTANSVAAPEDSMAPLILDVEHAPPVPRSTDTVTIRANLRDSSLAGVAATLHYRLSAADPPAFSTTSMSDDGLHGDGDPRDGVYGATLPALPVGSVVEFHLSATDGSNTRTWPAPTTEGQIANALYQVDDETHPGGEGIYRLVLSVPENTTFTNIDRDSDAQMNCTLIADDCSGPVIRYLCGMRVRGASSRTDNPPPMRVNLPRDTPWNGTTAMNLNSQYTWLQFIGMKLFQASDLPAPDTKRVAIRRNGVNRATGAIQDFGSFVHVQPLDGAFIDEKLPLDNRGNLYRKIRPDVDWASRNGNIDSYLNDGWSKETNASENQWNDLDAFLNVMNNASGSPDYIAQVEALADLDEWMRWFAVMALIANGETNVSNGADDDYSVYFGVADPRLVFLPHDLDTILGHGDASRLTNPQVTIFDMLERGDILSPLVPFFNNPAIRARYYQAFRDLILGSFSKPRFDALVTNHLAGWAPANTLADVIAFMDTRRAHIAGLVDTALGPPPATTNPTTLASLAGPHGNPYLSEVLAANVSAHANGGLFPDYIELHNSGAGSIALGGYSLSDDPNLPLKYVFPAGTNIGPGQFLLLYADTATAAPGLHLGFALDADGEAVSLYHASGPLVDSVTFGLQIPDRSIGRTGAGNATWSLNQPTPGSANVVQALGSPATLRLNEWLAKPDVVFPGDFIELFNPSALPVSLGGLALTDDPLSFPRRAVLPTLSFIPAGGFALFEPVGSESATPGNSAELPFKLGADHGWLSISGANAVEIDRVHFLCEARDQSQGRATDGAALFATFALPTPGLSNATDLSAENALLQSLRITEIMYHPVNADAEFIELRNIGAAPVNLQGVRFSQGISFEFPNTTLNPGQFIVAVANPTVFESLHGPAVNVAGPYGGKLDNAGERLRLEIGGIHAAILDFSYDDAWYPTTDGGGFSLLIVDERAEPGTWGEKASWTAGGIPNGTPGADDGFFVYPGPDQTLSLPAAATLNATVHYGALDPQTVALSWSLENGPAAAQFGSPLNEDTTVTAPLPGRYTFELTATPQTGPVVSGLVTVIFRDRYDAWATRNFGIPRPPLASPGDDFDLDGVDNLLEFVFGLDPNLPDAAGLPKASLQPGGFLALTYFRRYLDPTSATITPQVSGDLATWRSGTAFASESVLSSTVGGETVRVIDLAPAGTTPRHSLRLQVVGGE